MKDIIVVKIRPEQLKCALIFRLNHRYRTDISKFIVIFEEKTFTLYVNDTVNEEHIDIFKRIIMYQGEYINEPGCEVADILDLVYEEYGCQVWSILYDAYKAILDKRRHEQAETAAIGPAKLIESYHMHNDIFTRNEHLIYHVGCIGDTNEQRKGHSLLSERTKYVFYLGYLMGKGLIQGTVRRQGDE